MPTFFENLRAAASLPTRVGAQKANYLNDKDYIVQNTFRMGRDGINYGVGRDGKTYSYTIDFNNRISEPKLLSAGEQREAIKKATDGRVVVDSDIENQVSLTDMFRSASRMYNNGGNLVPGGTLIRDMSPGRYIFQPLQGVAYDYDDANDVIYINGLAHPDIRKRMEKNDYEAGDSASAKYPGEYVPTHELAHTAQYTAKNYPYEWYHKQLNEARSNLGKYPAGELFKKAVSDFLGQGYEISESEDIGKKMINNLQEQFKAWGSEDWDKKEDQISIMYTAAKNAGFDSIQEAAATISNYAGTTYPDEFSETGESVDDYEVFAEAYSDVLFNGDDAKPFSKELVRLWSDYVDRWEKRTGKSNEKRLQELKRMFDTLPEFKTNAQKNPSDIFVQNYRNSPLRYK